MAYSGLALTPPPPTPPHKGEEGFSAILFTRSRVLLRGPGMTRLEVVLLRRHHPVTCRIVIEDGAEPALDLRDAHALALGVVLHLIALDLRNAEVVRIRMRQVEARHGRAG